VDFIFIPSVKINSERTWRNMAPELKSLVQRVCLEHREAFMRLADAGGDPRHFQMNTPFGVHILECDSCESAVNGLINLDHVLLEKNIGRIESTSPYLPEPTEENTVRIWPVPAGHP
jgi:hypothetical protein